MSIGAGCRETDIEILNHLEESFCEELARDVLKGLTAPQKYIPSRYFYDARGSQLFEEICILPEYYQTRTELSILKKSASSIMRIFSKGDLVELGSGANWKIRMLLDAVDDSRRSAVRYIPVDVSESALIDAAKELLGIYPELEVLGVVADFLHHMELIPRERPGIIIFFGSTIGNLSVEESDTFFRSVSSSMKPGDSFLLGLDMIKPREILEAAYNDSQGITAEFNRNILNVLNHELHADFDPSNFEHLAFYNEDESRVEMHLRANSDIEVEIGELAMTVDFSEGETIHTEICRKFSREGAEELFSDAGLEVKNWHTDSKKWFSLAELTLIDG